VKIDLHAMHADVRNRPARRDNRLAQFEGGGYADRFDGGIDATSRGQFQDRRYCVAVRAIDHRGRTEALCGLQPAIVGSGPVGLAALLTARFYSPAEIIMVDLDDNRLETAKRFGATAVINSADGNAVKAIMNLTSGRGVDTAIEAVGIPVTFELCEAIIAPGGTIANVGVHGVKVDLHLENLWDRNITITTRLVDTVSTPMLLETLRSRRLDPKLLITHRFTFEQILDAYETFAHAADTRALKVIIAA